MSQEENNKDNRKFQNKQDDGFSANDGCFYLIVIWLGIVLMIGFMGSLSKCTSSQYDPYDDYLEDIRK